MCIIIKNLTYIHPDREVLFTNLNFSLIEGQKVSLIGNNGSGKSTLLKLISGILEPSGGEIQGDNIYYIPQHFGQYNTQTIAQALCIDSKLQALYAIENGNADEKNFSILADDWSIEERAMAALEYWGLKHLSLSDRMDRLSGGEKTKVFLSGIKIHEMKTILMDEPSNHLDKNTRNKLYELIKDRKSTFLIVSHDRVLLNLLDSTYELHKDRVSYYAGNYDFYKAQKEGKINALEARLQENEKSLKKAEKVAREAAERKQREDSRGKKKQEKKGMPRIMMGVLQDKAEQSSSKLKSVHTDKIDSIRENLNQIKDELPQTRNLRISLGDNNSHHGKILVSARDINYRYSSAYLWANSFSFRIISGERIAITGNNGSGKTTLIKLITGCLSPSSGSIKLADFEYVYIDQDYSLINDSLTIYEQVCKFNSRNLPEHELKTILHQFLFPKEQWDKKCIYLSGGEKMRLMLCSLIINNNTPDVLILDEPTNNLDVQSLEIIRDVIKNYNGTLIVISHDRSFLDEIKIERFINC